MSEIVLIHRISRLLRPFSREMASSITKCCNPIHEALLAKSDQLEFTHESQTVVELLMSHPRLNTLITRITKLELNYPNLDHAFYIDNHPYNLEEALTRLLEYELPEISGLEESSNPVQIMRPLRYSPKHPSIVESDQEKINLATRTNEDIIREFGWQSKYSTGTIGNAAGDHAEQYAFDVVKEVMMEFTSQNMFIARGVSLLKLETETETAENAENTMFKPFELDFLIVNQTLGKIIKIEVKKTFQWYKQNSKDGLIEQLHTQQALLQDWFGSKWNIECLFYAENPKGFLKDDECICSKNFALGKDELKLKLMGFFQEKETDKTATFEDFKDAVKLLMFCSPGSIMLKEIFENSRNVMGNQGRLPNVMVWCFPTPDQRAVLHQSHVLFYAPFGGGKTLLKIKRALELEESGNQVLFLVYHCNKRRRNLSKKTLLYLHLKKTFKDHPNIKLLQFGYMFGQSKKFHFSDIGPKYLHEVTKNYKHIFIDELDIYLLLLRDQNPDQSAEEEIMDGIKDKELVWMSFSGKEEAHNKDPVRRDLTMTVDDGEQYLQNVLQKAAYFQICRMNLALRTPKSVIEKVRAELVQKIEQGSHNPNVHQIMERLLFKSIVPKTLAEGSEQDFSQSDITTITNFLFHPTIENTILNATSGLVIVKDDKNVLHEKLNCEVCASKFIKGFFTSIFRRLKKKVLFHFDCCWYTISSTEQEINDNRKDSFIVTNEYLADGYEAEVVIELSAYYTNFSSIKLKTRSSGHLISLPPIDWSFEFLGILNTMEDSAQHGCQSTSCEYIDPMDLISKFFVINFLLYLHKL